MATKIYKYVSVRSTGTFWELGYIYGPIIHPVMMDIDTIHTLIINHRIVWEHSVNDPNKYTVLNLENYNDLNLYPENTERWDPTYRAGNYLVTVDDDPHDEKTMNTGTLYVEILDSNNIVNAETLRMRSLGQTKKNLLLPLTL